MAKEISEPVNPNWKTDTDTNTHSNDAKGRATTTATNRPSNRSLFEATYSGAQSHIPFIPRLRSDPPPHEPIPHSLVEFRIQEGRAARKRRLQELWNRLPKSTYHAVVEEAKAKAILAEDVESLTSEKAVKLKEMYEDELMGRCGGGASSSTKQIGWKEFKKYAEDKEVGRCSLYSVVFLQLTQRPSELWRLFHDELDIDGNGHLDSNELAQALQTAGKHNFTRINRKSNPSPGIHLTTTTLTDFMTFLTSSPHSHAITFAEFRDFLLLLPRKVNAEEIYRYYEVKKFMGDDGKGAARVTMEGTLSFLPKVVELTEAIGDVSLSAEDATMPILRPTPSSSQDPLADHFQNHHHEEEEYYEGEFPEEEEQHHKLLGGSTAGKFLLAGGVAGAGKVSLCLL